jgi:RHS repeat-associated protein
MSVDDNLVDGVEGKVTYFVYDREHVILDFVELDEIDGEGEAVLDKRYLYGNNVDQILVQEDSNGDAIWLLTDHLGTVRDLVDETGNLLNHFTYDSFGNLTSQTNTTWLARYLFTGREWDEAIGFYYYRARYYDAESGRFVGEDPLKFKSGDFNTYRYVFNNPIHFIDPSGQLSVELQTLLSLSNRIYPGTKNQNIRLYDFDSPAYSTALITANN